MFKFLIVFGLAAYVLLGVSADTEEGNDDNYELTCSDNADKLLEEGNAAFTGRFLYESIKKSPNKNLIMSPFSVFVPFGELALYAEGNTKDQLLQILNLPTKCDIRCVFPNLISNLRSEQNVILNLASKIYSTNAYPLTEDFLSDTKYVFDAEADTINVSDPKGSADKINQWVESQTNNRIKNIASPAMITQDTRLMLVNAIYFLGNWTKTFNKRDTMDRTFYLSSNKTVKVPTMYQQSNFKYGENSDLDCKVLEMTYKGGNFSFVIFLPNKIDGLNSLVENLQDQRKFYNAYDATRYEKVNVFIPKIKTESEFDLKDIMQKVGIVDIIDQNKSNLTGILEKYEPLHVSAAKQKAFVEVGETGTEAAAANVIAINALSKYIGPKRPVYVFKADRPFAFYTLNKRNIIFTGTFVTN